MTSQTAIAVSTSVYAAAVSSQEEWTCTALANLSGVEQADRELLAIQLRPVATKVAMDCTTRFVTKVFSFAFWSGLVFASIIEAVLWASRIPSQHSAAAIVAGAYLIVTCVAGPICWSQAHRLLSFIARSSNAARRHALKLFVTPMIAAGILYCTANVAAFNAVASHRPPLLFYVNEFAASGVVAALGFLIAYLAAAYTYARTLPDSTKNHAIEWACALTATAITAWLPATRKSLDPTNDPHFQSGLLRLLDCVVTIDHLGHGAGRARPHAVKSVIIALELTAADIELFALDRVPRFDTATRAMARQDGAKLASPIRNAKGAVARCIRPREYTEVAATLADFLVKWAKSDTNLMSISDNMDTLRKTPIWQRVISRAWNAILLATAGIVIPFLPIYKTDQVAGAQARYALLIAAILALASGKVPVWETIEKKL